MLYDSQLVTVPVNRDALRQRRPGLGFIMVLGERLAAAQDLDQVALAALEELGQLLDAPHGRFYLLDPERGALKLRRARNLPSLGLEDVSLGQGFTGRAALSRSFLAQRVRDLEDPERARQLAALGLVSVACLPLIAQEHLLGVVNLGSPQVMSLNQETIDLCLVAGSLVAVACQNTLRAQELIEQREALKLFSYTASHDLKSPVGAMRALSRLLERRAGPDLDEPSLQIMHQMDRAAERVEVLLTELNAYIQAKEAPLNLEVCDLTDLLTEATQTLEPELRRRGVRLVASDLGPARCDRRFIIRALQNLVENALKHGGPSLALIQVRQSREGGQVELRVADDGRGLGEVPAEVLFQAFQRGPEARDMPGSGLGLALVGWTAHRHGGRAWHEPNPGGGAVFCMAWPQGDTP